MPEIQGGKSNGTEISGHNVLENWVYPSRLASFPDNLENAVPLIPGNVRKCKPEFPVEWNARRNASVHQLT